VGINALYLALRGPPPRNTRECGVGSCKRAMSLKIRDGGVGWAQMPPSISRFERQGGGGGCKPSSGLEIPISRFDGEGGSNPSIAGCVFVPLCLIVTIAFEVSCDTSNFPLWRGLRRVWLD